MFVQRSRNDLAELIRAVIAPCCADDLHIGGPLTGAIPAKQRRQDLALRQIAGAAENDQIKWVNRYDARNHELSLPCPYPHVQC
jgi:hypothetical protein